MKTRGLCINCINDRRCNFPRRFPVLQCEEFTEIKPMPVIYKKAKHEKIKFVEEN